MAKPPPRAAADPFAMDDHLDLRPLLRVGCWGMCAVVALSAAVFSAQSDTGEKRAKVALATLRKGNFEWPGRPGGTATLLARANEAENETRRLNEIVRTLSSDRDRLMTRLAAVERNLDDFTTGSINRGGAAGTAGWPNTTAPNAGFPPQPFGLGSPEAVEAPAAGVPVDVPLPRPNPLGVINSYVNGAVASPPPEDGRRALGVDLGAADSPDGLRALWGLLRGNQPALLNDLSPQMAIRANARTATDELRLLAGPVANPEAAARICAAVVKDGFACRPAVFDGAKLAGDGSDGHTQQAAPSATTPRAGATANRPSPTAPAPAGPLQPRVSPNAQNLRPVAPRNQLVTGERAPPDRVRDLFSIPDR